jgi:hypothetical protein
VCCRPGVGSQATDIQVKDRSMSAIREFAGKHPRLVSWFVLALGMVIMLLWAAKDVGLLFGQMVALVVATILLAGLCVWIIGWE